VLHKPKEALPRFIGGLYESMASFCRDRSLYNTAEGFIGLAPLAALTGDVVVVLLGCPSPMILRPTYNGCFKAIGEARYGGFMDGEALLGTFPEGTQAVTRYEQQNACFRNSYFSSKNGSFVPVNPRLSQTPLPTGWRKVKHEREDVGNLFGNDVIGEEMPLIRDFYLKS
jgi:hypothetical protein